MKQLVEGGGHVFAVAGSEQIYTQDEGGDYLYRWRPDSADWALLRRAAPGADRRLVGSIRFQGAVDSRAYFNLEDAQPYYTDDGGMTWRPCNVPAKAAFRSNVIPFAGRLFAVFGDSLRVSSDQGATWASPVSRIRAVQLLAAGGLLYARNDSILVSADSGRTWAPRVEGLVKNQLDRFFTSTLVVYGDRVLCAATGGVYVTGPGETRWSPHGTGPGGIGRIFLVGSELFGTSSSLFRFDPVTGAWKVYAPWGPESSMRNTLEVQHLSGILARDGRWWVASSGGIAAYDPSIEEYAWMDRGIHLKEPYAAKAVSGHMVSVSRHQLWATPPDGAPILVRDFRKPGRFPGMAAIVNAEPVDSLVWVLADSVLFRFRFVDGRARLEDSLITGAGKFLCRGSDVISVINDHDPLTRIRLDTATVAVSRNSGATFVPFPGKVVSSFSSTEEVMGGMLAGDTAWLWNQKADLHAYDLKTGGYRLFATGLPVDPESGVRLQFLRIPAGMLMNQGNLFMLSRDGMRTWTSANQGLPATLPTSASSRTPIQWLNGRLFFSGMNTLYHSDDTVLDWKALDMNPLVGDGFRVSSGFVAPEGLYLLRPDEDVARVPWPDLDAVVARGRTKRPPPAGPAGMFRNAEGGVFFRGPGSDFDSRGRRIPGN